MNNTNTAKNVETKNDIQKAEVNPKMQLVTNNVTKKTFEKQPFAICSWLVTHLTMKINKVLQLYMG